MTSSSGLVPVKELKNVMYACCSRAPPDTLFSQEDLLALKVVPNDDVALLSQCVQALLDEGLLKVLTLPTGTVWKILRREEAERYKSMTPDEAMIYSYIDAAGREGIWSRTIKLRTNIHQSIMTRSIKNLESRGLIKSIKSVRWPARIFYMLASLTPSEDVTGGPWFTDGELDTDFVEVLCAQIELYITSKSFRRINAPSSALKKSSKSKATRAQVEALRDKELATPPRPPKPRERDRLLHFPPGYTGYPTLADIMAWLNDSRISEVPLAEEHVRQLMDILCYDRRVERVLDGQAYKAARRPDPPSSGGDSGGAEEQKRAGNGLTEAPCGRCPVFNLCEEGGPVSASNCEYFKDWLDL
ncbi:MAG: 34-kDa subunit of RNA polymerase III (C) [Thelocarpon impressellum]|nr:MAG: 34-kDa subunit of RNA polymerase III (C) [Thelocarpon impressellum]